MHLILKIALSVVCMLVAAAVIELIAGEPRLGFVPLATLPVLFVIWRRRKP